MAASVSSQAAGAGQVRRRRLEQRFGVGTGDGGEFGHGLLRARSSGGRAARRGRPALTSLRRICSAPLTASAATCSRSASRALTACCSASARAAATILLPSSVARALASSTMACARRSASARRCGGSLRALASSASTRLLAADSSALALSAAARPSAIFCARSSSAVGDRRPHELHREPDQDQEHDHLDDQGTGDAHFSSFSLGTNRAARGMTWVDENAAITSAGWRSAPGTGWRWRTTARYRCR